MANETRAPHRASWWVETLLERPRDPSADTSDRMITICVTVTRTQKEWVRAYARRHRRSMSWVMHEVLTAYLAYVTQEDTRCPLSFP